MRTQNGFLSTGWSMFSRIAVVSIFGIIMLGTLGCDKFERLDSMSESTKKMEISTSNMEKSTGIVAETMPAMNESIGTVAETMPAMNESIGEMAQSMPVMEKSTSSMDDQMKNAIQMARSGAHQVRTDCLRMGVDAKSFEDKVKHAACFMRGLEYQYWTNMGYDTLERRHELFGTSVDELFFTLQSYNQFGMFDNQIAGDMGNYLFSFLLSRQLPVVGLFPKPLNTNLSNIGELMFFYAISAALHYEDPLQKYSLKIKAHDGKILPVMTMDKLIYQALDYDRKLSANLIRSDEIPEYSRKVLSWKRLAIQLLKARVATLTTTAMIYQARIPYMSKIEGAWFLTGQTQFSQTIKRVFGQSKYTLNYDSPRYDVKELGILETEMYADWIRLAVETQKELMKNGESAGFDAISKNMVVQYNAVYAQKIKGKKTITAKDKAILEFEKNLNELRILVPSLRK